MKRLLAVAAALLIGFPAHAEVKGVRINVIAFAQPAADGNGYWQDSRPLPPCHAVALREGPSGGAESAFPANTGCLRQPGFEAAYAGFAAVGKSQLADAVARLKKAGYPLLLDRGWRQASVQQSPVLLRGGRTATDRQEIEGTVTLGGTAAAPVATLDITLTRMDGPKPQYTVIHETRTLKSGELNYFDHPLFGVILGVTAEAP